MDVSAALGASERALAWHDLEVGGYRADLALWMSFARQARDGSEPARILELGAGSGRVSLALARAGHRVTALDLERGLLDALERRAGGLAVETVCADAREFDLPRRDYALCLVPMQTLQLLADAGERRKLLDRVRCHLRPGAVLACAIVTRLEPFDCALGDSGPPPERLRRGGVQFVSRATAVRVSPLSIEIERERRVVAPGTRAADAAPERELIRLSRVSAAGLQREGAAAGLTAAGTRTIPATAEYAGCTAVMLRA